MKQNIQKIFLNTPQKPYSKKVTKKKMNFSSSLSKPGAGKTTYGSGGGLGATSTLGASKNADAGTPWDIHYKERENKNSIKKPIQELIEQYKLTPFALQCIDYIYIGVLNKNAKKPKYAKTNFSSNFAFKQQEYKAKAKSTFGTGGMLGQKTAATGAIAKTTQFTSAQYKNATKFVEFKNVQFEDPAAFNPETAKLFFIPTPTKVQIDQTSVDQLRDEISSSTQIVEDTEEQEELQYNYQTLFDKKSPITDKFHPEEQSITPIQLNNQHIARMVDIDPIKINSILINQSSKGYHYNYSRAGYASVDVFFPNYVGSPIDITINIGECFLDLHQLSIQPYNFAILVTVYNCWPKDENDFRSPENDPNGEYKNVLKSYCDDNDLQFIYYYPELGIFNFQIIEQNKRKEAPKQDNDEGQQTKTIRKNPTYGIYQLP